MKACEICLQCRLPVKHLVKYGQSWSKREGRLILFGDFFGHIFAFYVGVGVPKRFPFLAMKR